MFNALNHDYHADLTYPIRIVYDQSRLVPVSKLPTIVEFNATGYGWNILRKSFFLNQNPVFIKPSDLPRKNYITSYEIFPVFADQLKDIRINYFLRDTIHFDFDRVVTKKIFLKVNKDSISIAEGYGIFGAINIQPDHITITGPSQKIKAVKDTLSLHIPNFEVKGFYEENILIEQFEDSPLKVNLNEVLVKFESRPFEKEVKRIKVSTKNFPRNYSLAIDSVNIVLFSHEKLTPTSGDIIIEADYKKAKNNQVELKIRRIPKGVVNYSLKTKILEVVKL